MSIDTAAAAVMTSKEQISVSMSTAAAPRKAPAPRRIVASVLACAALALCCSLIAVAAVQAAAPRTPAWALTATAQPTNLAPGSSSNGTTYESPLYTIVATNTGARDTSGEVTITDTLPAGVTPTAARLFGYSAQYAVDCAISGQTVTCTTSEPVKAGTEVWVNIGLDVAPDASSGVNHATISGGGGAGVSMTTTTTVSSTVAPFDFLEGAAGLSTFITASDGSAVTQAGSHPFQITIDTGFSTFSNGTVGNGGGLSGTGPLRDVSVKLPPGMVVDPTATPTLCTEAQLESYSCPDASAVGLVTALTVLTGPATRTTALYNMVPPPGAPAALAFDALDLGIFVHLIGGVDAAGNYALTADARDILARPGNPILGVRTQIWGDPTDSSHDGMRGSCHTSDGPSCPVPATQRPFLTMPSVCSGPLVTTARADSWKEPGVFRTATTQTTDRNGAPVGVTGCKLLDFDPSLSVTPDVSVADSPTGLHVDLKVPQNSGLNSLATANLKEAVVTLPVGMSVSPSAADGLAACSPAQIGMGSNAKPSCPDNSKIGSVEVVTPLLADPLEGSVYVAAQNDNPSNSVLGIYVVAEGPGVVIKLAGSVHADRATGQLTVRFEDNPQLPFSDFKLEFFGGPRAALATPDSCGTFTTTSALSPWSGTPAVSGSDPFDITSGCGGGFAPSVSTSLANQSAGESGAFTLQVSRSDGQQHMRSIDTTLPQGLLAKVGSVPLCSDSDAAAGSCPASSQVGVSDAAAGPGQSPFHIAGKVFLTGPYKGGPYGLSVVTRAVAGPFDLGTVVVRASIRVDPITAEVTVVSDDVPNLLTATGDDGRVNGFPLRVRSIAVDMDRPNFMVAPTSCDPMSVAGRIGSWEGAISPVSSRFQVGDCAGLDLKPKLAIALTGKGQTTDDKHPGVHATVSQTAGQANLKKVVVSLPLSLALDPDNAQALCEFTDGSKVDPTCPKGSIVGKAVARTPILNQPLIGPVYFVKNIRKDPKSGREIRTLPKLVIPLTGENGLRLNLVGTSNVVDNRLVTTFANIPDAPVTDFTLDIAGGKSGILVVSGTDICKATQVADQQIDGHNGKTADADIYLQTPACPLKIISKKVGKTSVAIKISGLGAGKVTVTGKGIKKTTKTIAKSTVATITAKRTKGKPGKVTVSFDPTGPAKARKTTK